MYNTGETQENEGLKTVGNKAVKDYPKSSCGAISPVVEGFNVEKNGT